MSDGEGVTHDFTLVGGVVCLSRLVGHDVAGRGDNVGRGKAFAFR